MTEFKGSDVILTIGGVEAKAFTEESITIRLSAKVKIKICASSYVAPSPDSSRFWFTSVITNFGHTLHVTYCKPTKRQLRKWKRCVREHYAKVRH